MRQFEKLIEDALKAGDRHNPQFRRSVYEAALKAFEKTVGESPEPEAFQARYRPRIAEAITEIERRVLEGESQQLPADEPTTQTHDVAPEVSGSPAAGEDSTSEHFDNPPDFVDVMDPATVDADENLKWGTRLTDGNRVSLLVLGLIGVAVLIGIGYWYIFSDTGPMQSADVPVVQSVESEGGAPSDTRNEADSEEAETESANAQVADADAESSPVVISVGEGTVTRGEAKWTLVDGIGVLTDSSPEKNEIHQWVIREVKETRPIRFAIEVQSRQASAAYLQAQAIFSAPDVPSKIYTYVLNLAAGKVAGKGDLGFPERLLEKTEDGDFLLDTKIEGFGMPATLQIVVMPTLGNNATGSAFINRLVVEPSS